MARKIGSGIYKRIKEVNVHNENHPWRAMILRDVIEAEKRKEKIKANLSNNNSKNEKN